MKIRELKEKIDRIVTRLQDHEDPVVTIPLREVSMGPSASTEAKNVSRGIDWDANTVFVWPEKDLIGLNTPEEYIIRRK